MKILIIFYQYDQISIVGSIRLTGLIKYLNNEGWELLVLTNDSSLIKKMPFEITEAPYESTSDKWKRYFGFKSEVIEENKKNRVELEENKTLENQRFSGHRKFIEFSSEMQLLDLVYKLWFEIFVFPDFENAWYKPAVEEASKILEKEKVDIIFSSSSPVTSHIIAHELKKRYNIPWVADMRDLWTNGAYYEYSFIRKIIEQRLEIKTLKRANALTTVSKPLAEDLKNLHKNKKVFVIPNGFDPDLKNKISSVTDELNIMHTGRLLGRKRDPELLFKALNELNKEKKIDIHDFRIEFYGESENWLKNKIKKYDIEDIVKLHGFLPRNEIIEKQRNAQILLLLRWNNPYEDGVFTGKIFEYLAAKRPILAIGYKGGVLDTLLEKTNTGVSLDNVNEIKNEILKAYLEFKSSGEVSYNGIREEVDKYSHKEMAKKFSNVFNNVIKGS